MVDSLTKGTNKNISKEDNNICEQNRNIAKWQINKTNYILQIYMLTKSSTLYTSSFCNSKIFVKLISTYIYAFFYTDIEKSKKNETSKKDDNKTER